MESIARPDAEKPPALKAAEEKWTHAQELLRTLLDNLPDRIYFKDRQSRFVYFSKSFYEFHGIKPEEVLGKTDADLFTPEHARPAFEDEQDIIRTGRRMVGKLEKETHPDGRVTWALTSKMPWVANSGAIIGTFGISKDVTALKQAEADLESAHRKLVDASRLAGMAEVATDVLHNVGNTLNSINVSCALAVDALKKWNLANLAKVPAMLQEHAGHLDDFLTMDARGKHLTEYLAAIPPHFDENKSFLLRELGQLRQNVEHVNQIVAMQQSYARVAGAEEEVEISQLIEDALRINLAALDRHAIQVTREFTPLPPILVDKHKVLQILINLIRNAKYALSDSGRPDRILTLRVDSPDPGHVRLQVIDNGIGIAPENLTRIFAHGFTTRRDGHGFGLHSGALAARELGGSLTVSSQGAGRGAEFTLLLPRKAPTAPSPISGGPRTEDRGP